MAINDLYLVQYKLFDEYRYKEFKDRDFATDFAEENNGTIFSRIWWNEEE